MVNSVQDLRDSAPSTSGEAVGKETAFPTPFIVSLNNVSRRAIPGTGITTANSSISEPPLLAP
jgi:hypothetical protein